MPDAAFNDAFPLAAHPPGCGCSDHHVRLAAPETEPQEVLAPNGKPIFTLEQIVNQLTRSGDAWNGVGGNPIPNAGLGTITFGFFNTASQVYSSEKNQFSPLSEAQRNAVREAFAIWGDFINISFVETTVPQADINLGNLNSNDSYFSAYANYPGFGQVAGDIWFNTNAPTNSEIAIAEPGFRTILHEIGHALGISHPGNYNASPNIDITYDVYAEYYQDSYEYTVMSYFASSSTGAIRDSFAATPLAHDIAAIQSLYGANLNTRTGDTIYGFNSNAGRTVFDFNVHTSPVIAIWDAGGVDTLDFSGWSSGSTIDLSDGGFSDGGRQTSNVQIAFGTVIENAVAGAGADVVIGNGANNVFYLQLGGADTVSGFGGNDAFYFGAALDGSDKVDGGGGADTLVIQGQYANLLLGDVQGIEALLALPGNDVRFGAASGALLSYAITSQDLNVAAGLILTVSATLLRVGENLAFDGSAEVDGNFRMFTGAGNDTLAGGAGSDGFFFGADDNLTGADRVDGNGGADSLALRGNYSGARAVDFEATSFTDIEVLVFLSGLRNEYGGPIVPGGFDYDVATADGNVAAGQRLDVIGTTLSADESIAFDGSAELDGSFRILAGAGNDLLKGGFGNDMLYGGLGKDWLEGGAGIDTFVYRFANESAGPGYDTIAGFDPGVDLIDLPGNPDGLAAVVTTGSLSAASFDGDLGAALDALLGAGQAVAFTANAGDLAGRTFLVADGNGAAGYQAGADIVIELVDPVQPIAPGADFFI